jgi:hypothetical protein
VQEEISKAKDTDEQWQVRQLNIQLLQIGFTTQLEKIARNIQVREKKC